MCRVLRVSRSGYYAWRRRTPGARAREDAVLAARIRAIHEASDGIYGTPRIHAELRSEGRVVGRHRVARLMRLAGLSGVTRRRRRKSTTRSREGAETAPDRVRRRFTADAPNELWVADATHVPTREGTLYLATIQDAYSRRIVGWSMSSRQPAELMVAALRMALGDRRPRRVVHHSDHGSQYTSKVFRKVCHAHHVRMSMGRVGDCYDNALAESWFATLECELIDRQPSARFETREEARRAIFAYIEGFYNRRRRHSALGYRSPAEFEAGEIGLQAAG